MNQEPPYEAGKWQRVRVLLDSLEMESLFQDLGEAALFPLGGVVERKEENLSLARFFSIYKDYVQALEEGRTPDKAHCSSQFSLALTHDPGALYVVHVGEDKQMIKIRRPVIQLQEHTMDYSSDDHRFRSMVFGRESITWGIQFSYPQLFTDPKTKEVVNVLQADFPNTALFRKLQKWVRRRTRPTPFIIQGEIIHVPVRLGEGCFKWIQNHPQLKSKGLHIDVT